jgi:hypothetical protein
MPAKDFGRVGHLPAAQLTAVIDGMRARGLVGTDGWLTAAGRATKERVEALTDRLAEAPYNALTPASSTASSPTSNRSQPPSEQSSRCNG